MRELRQDGHTIKVIARLLNRTPDGVNSFLRYVHRAPDKRPTFRQVKRVPKPVLSPSEQLRIATLIAIAAYANECGTDIDTAANQLLYARRAG